MRPFLRRIGRTALAVAALYGLLLGLFVAGMAPVGMPEAGLLCAPAGAEHQAPADLPHREACCTLACAAGGLAPIVASVAHPAPLSHPAALTWVALSPAAHTGVFRSSLPRGPPTA